MAEVNTPVDELLAQTIELFENGIKTANINVAIENVTAWISFLNNEGGLVATQISALLTPLLENLSAGNTNSLKQNCEDVGKPTQKAGDPTAPPASRPKQISRLGILLCGW